jgi:cytoskeletal protein CcmA (bactofilin family)
VAKGASPRVIDGLTSVRMARHAGAGTRGPKLGASRSRLPATEHKPEAEKKPAAAKPASRIGHTAVPDRNEIVCPDCGYEFVLQGKILKTYCPKCRTLLEMSHIVLEEEARGSLRTIGTIEVGRKTRVEEGTELVAGRLIVAGDARPAKLRACSVLELRRGGQVDLARTTLRDLLVADGGRLSTVARLTCRNAEIAGTLRAKLFSVGRTTVRAGGLLQGEMHGAHLVVEEGGGLVADVFLSGGAPQGVA